MAQTHQAKLISRSSYDLKVVLTSGYVGPQDVPADITFVPKPWRVDALAETVTKPH